MTTQRKNKMFLSILVIHEPFLNCLRSITPNRLQGIPFRQKEFRSHVFPRGKAGQSIAAGGIWGIPPVTVSLIRRARRSVYHFFRIHNSQCHNASRSVVLWG